MSNSSLQYPLQDDDQLCFIHITKTAGSTLTSIVDAKFHVHEICPEPDAIKEICPDFPENLAPEAMADWMTRYRFIRGHIYYGDINPLLKKPLYMTMVREPIERAISVYNFFGKSAAVKALEKQGDLPAFLEAAAAELRQFMGSDDPEVRNRVSNPQTRRIASSLSGSSLSDEELLAQAKQNLERFLFVGVMERFQESVFLLSYIFGWDPMTNYQNLRVVPRKLTQENLPADVLQMLLDNHQLDIELYSFAKELFERRFTQMESDLKTIYKLDANLDLRQSETLSQLLEQQYKQRYREQYPSPVKTLDFDFTQPMAGGGWQRRNGDYNGLGDGTTIFRWTGPGTESTLDFPLASDTDFTIRLRIVNAIAPDILQSLALKVNDHPIPLSLLSKDGNVHLFQGTIPKTAIHADRAFSRLTFTVNRTDSLKTINPKNPDRRLLGIAVQRIQIFPATAHPRDPAYLLLPFPWEEPAWSSAATFLKMHLNPTDRLAAPIGFIDWFPDQFCAYTAPFREKPDLNWVVVNKGCLEEADYPSLRWAMSRFRPVFANEVFVILSQQAGLPTVGYFSKHGRSLWVTWYDLQTRQGDPRRFLNPIPVLLRAFTHRQANPL